MMETGRASQGNGLKIAALLGLGVGAAILLSGDSAKASGGTPTNTVDPCKDLEAKAGPVIDKATKADIDKLGDLMESAKLIGCTDLVAKIAKKIVDLGTVVPPPKPASTTTVFNANNAPFPIAAHAIALTIGKEPVSSSTPLTDRASDGTYASLRAYAQYGSGNLANLQRTAGITPDGVYGPQTQKAFDYFFFNATRPDGTTEATRTISVSGELLFAGCGHELSHADAARVGSCCSACEASGGSCAEESAADQISNVVALRSMNKAFGGPDFGMKGFGGTVIAGFGGGVGSPNPKPNVGGCSTGSCSTPASVSGEVDLGPQKRAVASLGALRSKVGAELHPLVDAAVTAVQTNGMIDLSVVPAVPGDEAIRACLQTYNNERALALA